MPKILDCTLRDGGLVNDSNFSADFARAALDACEAAGIDIVEVGFRNGENFFSPDKFGKLRFCKESDLREIFGDKPRKTKLCALADAGKSAPFPPRDKSVISRMRCAFYAENIDKALELLESAADDGYETSACMMAAPQIEESARTKCLERLAESKIDTIYLMDSFGTLTPAEAETLCRQYKKICAESGKLFGAHFHNNLQCAFANTLAAINAGADTVDATIGGLGKGAGNCPTELLSGFLRGAQTSVPLAEMAQKYVEPIKQQHKCGFYPQYMLTALLKIHPRPAMQYSAEENPPSLSEFFGEIKSLSNQARQACNPNTPK